MKKILLLGIFIFSLLAFLTFSGNTKTVNAACSSSTCSGACSGCSLNGTSCQTKGYYCSNSTTICGSNVPCCVCGWSAGSGCSASACSTPAPTPTPSSTPAPTSSGACVSGIGSTNASCGGQTACKCNATTCMTQGYYCYGGSSGTCTATWTLGTPCSDSSCNSGLGCSGSTPTPTPSASPSPTPTGVLCYTGCGSCSSYCATSTTTCTSGGGSLSCPSCTCVPNSSCSAQGATCGTVSDGCKYISCGTCPSGEVCTNNSCVPAPTPTPTPPSTNTVSGTIFLDQPDKDGKYNNGESPYTTSAQTITACPGVQTSCGSPTATTQTSTSNGSYSLTLPDGQYTIITTVPASYSMTTPNSAPAPYFLVTVGSGCSVGASQDGVCNSGDITGLNFGISNLDPWIQSTGSDIWINGGFSDPIPSGATCGTGSNVSYASINNPSSGTPGLIYSGNSTANYGQGSASLTPPYGWSVGSATYPETYSTNSSGVIQTSYNYISSLVTQNGITATDISSYCTGGTSSCVLSSSLPNGVYIAKNGLTLTGSGYTFPSGKNFVILVNGALNINEKIIVPNGSTAFFTVSGNITVTSSIGEASTTSCNISTQAGCDIEGYYSSDQNFIVAGISSCPTTADTRLNVAGAIVVNAALKGGTFQNQRDLCAGDGDCPVFTITERPDFVLNSPFLIMNTRRIYQEIAP